MYHATYEIVKIRIYRLLFIQENECILSILAILHFLITISKNIVYCSFDRIFHAISWVIRFFGIISVPRGGSLQPVLNIQRSKTRSLQ